MWLPVSPGHKAASGAPGSTGPRKGARGLLCTEPWVPADIAAHSASSGSRLPACCQQHNGHRHTQLNGTALSRGVGRRRGTHTSVSGHRKMSTLCVVWDKLEPALGRPGISGQGRGPVWLFSDCQPCPAGLRAASPCSSQAQSPGQDSACGADSGAWCQNINLVSSFSRCPLEAQNSMELHLDTNRAIWQKQMFHRGLSCQEKTQLERLGFGQSWAAALLLSWFSSLLSVCFLVSSASHN